MSEHLLDSISYVITKCIVCCLHSKEIPLKNYVCFSWIFDDNLLSILWYQHFGCWNSYALLLLGNAIHKVLSVKACFLGWPCVIIWIQTHASFGLLYCVKQILELDLFFIFFFGLHFYVSFRDIWAFFYTLNEWFPHSRVYSFWKISSLIHLPLIYCPINELLCVIQVCVPFKVQYNVLITFPLLLVKTKNKLLKMLNITRNNVLVIGWFIICNVWVHLLDARHFVN